MPEDRIMVEYAGDLCIKNVEAKYCPLLGQC
jgi:hypothetical protein